MGRVHRRDAQKSQVVKRP